MCARGVIVVVSLWVLWGVAACDSDDNSESTGSEPADDDTDDDSAPDDDADDDADDDGLPVNPFLYPGRPGPYPVGNTSFFLEDDTRALGCGEGNRRLVVEVWYPATDDADAYPENTLYDFFLDQQEEAMAAFAEHGDMPPPDNYPTGSYRDAPLRDEPAAMPLIVFSHGFTSNRFQNYSTANWLASHGYAVVSPDHTCNALVAPFPDGIIGFSLLDAPFTIFERVADVRFLIDVFTQSPPAPFEGRIDAERVGIMGHSFGGFTVSETIKHEPRAGAMVQLAAFGLPGVPDDVTAPSLFVRGEQDKIMAPFGAFHDAYRDQMPAPKIELSFADTGHFAFSDLCVFSPWLAEDGNGCGEETRIGSDELFTNPTPAAMNDMMSPYITAFFGAVFFAEPELWHYLETNHHPELVTHTFWP